MIQKSAKALTAYVNLQSTQYEAETIHVVKDWWVIMTNRRTRGVAPAVVNIDAYLKQYDGTSVMTAIRTILHSFLTQQETVETALTNVEKEPSKR